MSDLRRAVIRLAHVNPVLRPHLLPLVKEAASRVKKPWEYQGLAGLTPTLRASFMDVLRDLDEKLTDREFTQAEEAVGHLVGIVLGAKVSDHADVVPLAEEALSGAGGPAAVKRRVFDAVERHFG